MFALGMRRPAAMGLNVRNGRIAILAMAVLLGCFTASAVGLIGFVGLAAPNLARMSGARTPKEHLIWSPVIGAALLWLADGITQTTGLVMRELPTGTLTALLGAAVLLVMLSTWAPAITRPTERRSGDCFSRRRSVPSLAEHVAFGDHPAGARARAVARWTESDMAVR